MTRNPEVEISRLRLTSEFRMRLRRTIAMNIGNSGFVVGESAGTENLSFLSGLSQSGPRRQAFASPRQNPARA